METYLLHPAHAVGAGIVKPALCLDQHVQTHEETERILPPVIIDDAFVYDKRSAARQRLICLGYQHLLLFQIPVMQDVSHRYHVGVWDRSVKEAARIKMHSTRQPVLRNVVLEDRRNLWKVEPDARNVWVCQCNLRD